MTKMTFFYSYLFCSIEMTIKLLTIVIVVMIDFGGGGGDSGPSDQQRVCALGTSALHVPSASSSLCSWFAVHLFLLLTIWSPRYHDCSVASPVYHHLQLFFYVGVVL